LGTSARASADSGSPSGEQLGGHHVRQGVPARAGFEDVDPDLPGGSCRIVPSPHREDVGLWLHLYEDRETAPDCLLETLLQRDVFEELPDLRGSLLNLDPLGDVEVPQPHEGVHGRVHGQEVEIDHRKRNLAYPALRPPAVVAHHGVPQDFGREVGLALEDRLDPHSPEVGLSDARRRVRLGGLEADGMPSVVVHDPDEELGRRFDVPPVVVDVLRSDLPVPFDPKLGGFDAVDLACRGQRVASVRKSENERAEVQEVASEHVPFFRSPAFSSDGDPVDVVESRWTGEALECALRVDVLDGDPRSVPTLPRHTVRLVGEEGQGDPSLEATPGGTPGHRQAREVERKVEPDDKRPFLECLLEENGVHEFSSGQEA
jgi:hypothetical protein